MTMRSIQGVAGPVGIWAAIALATSGCGAKPHPVQQDVAFYRAHADIRRGVLGGCANDPGSLRSDPDCLNAKEAERLESIGSLRELPPLGLPATPRKSRK